MRILFTALLVAAASAVAEPAALRLDLGGGDGIDLAWIAPGTVVMGSDAESADEAPAHPVRLTRGFWIGRTEVTQTQWQRITGENPSLFKGGNHPVESVSWHEAQAFLKKLNHTAASQLPAGLVARLPTEAEWVYACRAGTRTRYWFGDDADDLARYGNFADASETIAFSWKDPVHRDGFSGTAPVGSFPANPWGLHDMHGNVWEWCADWYGPYPAGEVVDPTGPASGQRRVIRGGSWGAIAGDCRSANRYRFKPEVSGGNVGLRVVVGAPLR